MSIGDITRVITWYCRYNHSYNSSMRGITQFCEHCHHVWVYSVHVATWVPYSWTHTHAHSGVLSMVGSESRTTLSTLSKGEHHHHHVPCAAQVIPMRSMKSCRSVAWWSEKFWGLVKSDQAPISIACACCQKEIYCKQCVLPVSIIMIYLYRCALELVD